MEKQEYKNILQKNGLSSVLEFLEKNNIKDFETISKIYNKGMNLFDYMKLQEAIKEVKTEIEQEEY